MTEYSITATRTPDLSEKDIRMAISRCYALILAAGRRARAQEVEDLASSEPGMDSGVDEGHPERQADDQH